MIFGVLIANCVYYNKIRMATTTQVISKSTAQIMLGFNVTMAVAAGFIFVWSLIRVVLDRSNRAKDIYIRALESAAKPLGSTTTVTTSAK